MRGRLALAELRAHPSRAGAVVLAIMISVGFITASLTFVSTEQRAIGAAATASTAAADVVVEQNGDWSTAKMIKTITGTDGVRAAEPTYETNAGYETTAGNGQLFLESVSPDPGLRSGELDAGRWPTGSDEIVLEHSSARHAGVGLGDRLTVSLSHGDGSDTAEPFTVVGISSASRSLFGGTSDAGYVLTTVFDQPHSPYYPSVFVVDARPGVDPQALSDRLSTALSGQATVQTSAAYAEDAIRSLTRGADVFRIILLIFGAVAVLVGSIIIVNTFTILLVQRRRQIGLLRVVGAETRQVRGSVLIEALVIGAVGSLLGAALGVGLAGAGAAVTGSIGTGLAVPWIGLAVTVLGGTLITVGAAALPVRRAMRVAPLDALRPVADETTTRRSTRTRTIIAGSALLLGVALITVALIAGKQPLLLSVTGSFLAAVGLIALSPTLVPAVLRGVGVITGRIGPVNRLAAANSVRNPGRAAATCVALMLGVGLIVTLQVGAASTKTTVLSELDTRFPVDLTIRTDKGALPASVTAGVGRIAGIGAAVPVTTTQVKIDGLADFGAVTLQGPGPDAAAATNAGFGKVDDQTVLLSRFTAKSFGVRAGQQLTLRHGDRQARLTVGLSDLADDATVLTSRTELLRLDPSAPLGALWASVPDVDQAGDVMAQVGQLTGDQALTVGGSLDQTADYVKLLDTLLTVATALLAVAVLIALIGVGNTLGLSVLERTRESALLRALGLQRRQLRAMLAVEAVLLALVGAVIGIAAGTAFGWIGTLALSRQLELGKAQFAMSATQTALVVAVAVLAGAIASVLPARRAARATPTEALADV